MLLFLLWFIILIGIVLGLIFYNRIRVLSFIFLGASVLCLLALIIGLVKNHLAETEYEKELVGVFQIDIIKSEADSILLKNNKDLILIVHSNNQLEFSRTNSLIDFSKAAWEYEDDGEFGRIELSYDGFNGRIAHANKNSWTFYKNNRISDKEPYEYEETVIEFKRKK